MANRYRIKKRCRIRDGVRYISYRTLNTFEDAKIEVMNLRKHGVPAVIYNNHSKRNYIVFVKDEGDCDGKN